MNSSSTSIVTKDETFLAAVKVVHDENGEVVGVQRVGAIRSNSEPDFRTLRHFYDHGETLGHLADEDKEIIAGTREIVGFTGTLAIETFRGYVACRRIEILDPRRAHA